MLDSFRHSMYKYRSLVLKIDRMEVEARASDLGYQIVHMEHSRQVNRTMSRSLEQRALLRR